MNVKMYQAGAGSGKTYKITSEIVARLASGETRPERILATTFTRKAAAELKNRIQERLLNPQDEDQKLPLEARLELAAAVDQALVGTVHSVGHQLLSRYALHLGISPRLEPMEEKAQERHLRRIFSEMASDRLEQLQRLADGFSMESVQKLVLELLDQKRGNAVSDEDFRASMKAGTERLIAIISGGSSIDLPEFSELYELGRKTLDVVAQNGDSTGKTSKALSALAELIRSHQPQWSAWGKIAKLDWAKKSENDAAALVGLARRANVHARMHQELLAFNELLADSVIELQHLYRSYKEGRGLVDFTDLEEQFLELVNNPKIRADLASSIDLVVVDEFQDTNPIQLAIFQGLRDLTKGSLWVGDFKQAIYGFRGTDAQLMRDVAGTVPPEHLETLGKNWRSTPGLVAFVNEIFEPIFGPDTVLEPAQTGPARIERWLLQGGRKELRQEALFAQIQELLQDYAPEDVAVLVRTNKDASTIANGLQGAGIPALIQTAGLLSTKEGAMMLSGVRLVADPRDQLAAASIRTIEDEAETPAWFNEVLADPKSDVGGDSVAAVKAINPRTRTPSAIVNAVIHALRLPDRIAAWGNPARRSANLDELVLLGQKYESEAEQEGKAASITGLMYWLEALRANEEDLLPIPQGVAAVRILTLHVAKGLEWPVVILYQDGEPPEQHPFRIQVTGGNAATGNPLAGRRIQYWTYPFGTTFYGQLNSDGCGIRESAQNSAEGQAIADRQQKEAQRVLYVGFTRAKETLILAEGRPSALKLIHGLNERFPEPDAAPVEYRGATYATITCDDTPATDAAVATEHSWFQAATGTQEHPRRYWSPSKAEMLPSTTAQEPLPGTHPFPLSVTTSGWTDLGQAVHAYMASIPAMRNLSTAEKQRHAASCLARWHRYGDLEPSALVAAGERFEKWLEGRAPGATWHIEVPVSAPRAAGGTWSGVVDLFVRNATESIVIDHKSVDLGETAWAAKAAGFAGQLKVYMSALDAEDAAIHLPLGGGIVQVKLKQ